MTTPLHVFENHDEAYHIWRRAGLTGKTLVHLDAHHDMAWLESRGELHIGNYLCQAMKDGIVANVFWIVPDPTWTSAPSRKHLYRIVKRLTKTYPAKRSRVRVGVDRMTMELMDVPVTIGPMASLPHQATDVLLDIDTDFMLIPIVSSLVSDADVERPWIWPDELVSRLHATGIAPAMTTIAYSVDGGYTSLHWKYLGAALAAELEASSHDTARLRSGFGCLREAAAAASRDDLETAEIACKRAEACLPGDAAPVYNLARWYAKSKRVLEARALYSAARDFDPSYATAYNNRGSLVPVRTPSGGCRARIRVRARPASNRPVRAIRPRAGRVRAEGMARRRGAAAKRSGHRDAAQTAERQRGVDDGASRQGSWNDSRAARPARRETGAARRSRSRLPYGHRRPRHTDPPHVSRAHLRKTRTLVVGRTGSDRGPEAPAG